MSEGQGLGSDMKTILTVLVFICATDVSFGSDLDETLSKAGSYIVGSDGWYEALSLYVERGSTNSPGRLTPQGFKAIRKEFEEITEGLLKSDPPLDLKTELSLATDAIRSDKIRDLPKFLSRLSRICSLVGRQHVEGRLKDTRLMFRCNKLELFVMHHGVRAYLPKNEQDNSTPVSGDRRLAPQP